MTNVNFDKVVTARNQTVYKFILNSVKTIIGILTTCVVLPLIKINKTNHKKGG